MRRTKKKPIKKKINWYEYGELLALVIQFIIFFLVLYYWWNGIDLP